MKKGCFLTFLTFLTISLGIVFYLFKNQKVSFEKIAKPVIFSMGEKEFKNKFSKIKGSPEKDSLASIVKRYVASFKDEDTFDKLDEKFFDQLRFAVKDSEIDSLEISLLKDLFNKHIASLHARQKKNAD